MVHASIDFIRSGKTTFTETGFAVRYLSDFHTFHLHQYHGRYKLGAVVHELSPGTVTLSPAGIPSYYDLDHPGEHLYVHFRDHGLPDLNGGLVADPDTFYSRQLTRITGYGRSVSTWGEAAAQAAVEEMVFRHLDESFRGGSWSVEDPLERAYGLLEERSAEPLYVPELARTVGMSPNYLAKLFKERYGRTIKRRLLDVRIERSKYLLRNTNLTVREIGIRVGVPDPQYFNKQFRREVGCSPCQYRGESR